MTITNALLIVASLWVLGWVAIIGLGKLCLASEKHIPHNL